MPQRSLRIGFLTPEYPTEEYNGGIGSYVRQMAHSMVGLGQSASVLLCVSSGEGITWDGPVQICRLAVPEIASHLPQPLGKRSGLIFARHLAERARDLNLDLLEAPEFSGLTAFLSLVKPHDLKVAVRLHECSAICRSFDRNHLGSIEGRIRNRLQDWLERRAIETADSVTAISEATTHLTKKMLRLRRDDFRVTPNPVGDLFFSPAEDGPTSGEPLVLFAGRLQWKKGPDLLVRAVPALLKRHPNARFCLAGGDTNTGPAGTSMFAYLLSLVSGHARTRVEFTGFLKPEQLLKKYHEATVCVFPSRWEGFGLAAAEAMACGKPVVVSDAPGFRELICDGVTGIFAKGEDVAALASAIDGLLCDPQLRQSLATAGRDVVFKRSHGSAVGRSTLSVYREAVLGPAFLQMPTKASI